MKPSLIYDDGTQIIEVQMSPEQIKDVREAKGNPHIESITVQIQNRKVTLLTQYIHEIN